ncbi:TM2 domain-containing protein [Tepidibacillus fermentans]|uniref:TM2 domain-containing protein n=1 Tax=Tepidibacillus fermentans TaxID=1281767 RepID=UPI001049B72C|nr:TM2 domain-containing protein [Tepidibacillus fermentans]
MDLLSLKKDLTAEELTLVNMELERKKKSSTAMWILWLFLGGLGGHRYYLGDIGRGITMTLTLGGLGIWTLIDAFFIGKRLEHKNLELEMEIIDKVKKMRSLPQQ